MNQKKFGSSQWSIRSDTLVAKTVPLSTVTPRHSPTPSRLDLWIDMENLYSEDAYNKSGPLTCAQRTQKLSMLLKMQRSGLKWKSETGALLVGIITIQT